MTKNYHHRRTVCPPSGPAFDLRRRRRGVTTTLQPPVFWATVIITQDRWVPKQPSPLDAARSIFKCLPSAGCPRGRNKENTNQVTKYQQVSSASTLREKQV